MKGQLRRLGAGLHLRLGAGALSASVVVCEGEREAVEGARDRRGVHAEHRVQVGVAGDVAAHRGQVGQRGAAES